MPKVGKDDRGYSVLLADVPNAGISKRNVSQKSGNPNYDARSGKFSSGPKKQDNKQATGNRDSSQYARLLAAARDAGRKYPEITAENMQEFLKGRVQAPESIDIERFIAVVRQQKLADMADVLADKFGGDLDAVKVTATAAFTKAAVRDMTTEEQTVLMNLIVSKGGDEESVRRYLKLSAMPKSADANNKSTEDDNED